MVAKTDIGPRVFASGSAVSALSYAPPFDRETLITRIYIADASADDSWTVNVGGREIMRFHHLQNSYNQACGGQSSTAQAKRNLFDWFYDAYGDHLSIPVPQGLSITVTSVGGATANVIIMGIDLSPGSLSTAMLNHYAGQRFIMPQVGYVNAALTAAGEKAFDSVIKPAWVGSIFTGVAFPVGWQAALMALFIEGISNNTYSGSANHVSYSDHIGVVKNGERLFSHVQAGQTGGTGATAISVPSGQLVTPGGIPDYSAAATAGSANIHYSTGPNPYPALHSGLHNNQNVIDPPLLIRGGDVVQFYLGATGDFTGNPSYATLTVLALLEVRQVT